MASPEPISTELEFLLKSGATYELAPNVGADVLDRIDTFLARFVAYPDEHARHAHVLWIMHTWFMDCCTATPRLLFLSPEAGSGKTRALTVTSHLVPHPDFTGDLSPAGLYRSIDDSLKLNGGRPTMLYDELDTVFGPGTGHSEMRRLIDIGHDRNASVIRFVRREVTRFPVYAAMAMAGKMHVQQVPSTIRTRSVVIHMQRRAPREKIERWNRRTSPAQAAPLRELIQLWAELVHEYAHQYLPELPEEVWDRDADVWEPLLTVADLAGGHWPETARVTAVTAVTAAGTKGTPSLGMQLLWDINAVFASRNGRRAQYIWTGELLAALKAMPESPCAALTPMTMARLLSGYGIRPALIRDGTEVLRGYWRRDFTDAWSRYPAPPPQPVTAVTAVTAVAPEGITPEGDSDG